MEQGEGEEREIGQGMTGVTMEQGGAREQDGGGDAEAPIQSVPDDVLSGILVVVSRKNGGFGHALVCERWAAQAPGVQALVRVAAGGMFDEARLVLELGGFSQMRSLVLEPESVVTLSDHFLSGLSRITQGRLQSLEIMRDAATDTCKFTEKGLSDFFVSCSELRQLSLLTNPSPSIELPDTISCLSALRHLDLGTVGPNMANSGFLLARGRPRRLWGLGSLRHLLLETFTLDILPGIVSRLTALRSLQVTSNRLRRLPAELGVLTGLRDLRLCAYSLETASKFLPSSLSGLSLLTSLDAHLERWVDLDTVLSLTALRRLHLSRLYLTSLPPEISHLAELTELDLNCFNLECLPDEVGLLKNLRVLRLRGLPKNVAPHGFFPRRQGIGENDRGQGGPVPFASLEELSLEVGSRKQVDISALVHMPRLRVLDLRRNWQMELPVDLGRLTMLAKLQEFRMDLSLTVIQLTPSFFQLRAVHKLHLRDCQALEALPYLGALTALRDMNLGTCSSLTCIPPSVSRLINLRKLEVSRAYALRKLPAELGSLPALEQLVLWGMPHLAALPESIGQLSCLTKLVLIDSGAITTLPSTLGNLQRLQQLRIGSCEELQSLPESLGRVTTLRQLLLEGLCSIKAIPDSFSALTALRDIRVVGCTRLASLAKALQTMPLLLDSAKRSLSRLKLRLPEQGRCAARCQTVRSRKHRSRNAKGAADVVGKDDAGGAASDKAAETEGKRRRKTKGS